MDHLVRSGGSARGPDWRIIPYPPVCEHILLQGNHTPNIGVPTQRNEVTMISKARRGIWLQKGGGAKSTVSTLMWNTSFLPRNRTPKIGLPTQRKEMTIVSMGPRCEKIKAKVGVHLGCHIYTCECGFPI